MRFSALFRLTALLVWLSLLYGALGVLEVNKQFYATTRYRGRPMSDWCFACSVLQGIDYSACSMETASEGWNDGLSYFIDPLDRGYMVASMNVALIGTFNCLPGGLNASLELRLGSFNSTSFSAPPLPEAANCWCPNCAATVPMSGLPPRFPNGLPNYVYGGNNTLQIAVLNHKYQDICLSLVNMTLNAEYVFPSLESVIPDLTSSSATSTITIIADYINPNQEYACYFNGDSTPYQAVVNNLTSATCKTPPLSVAQRYVVGSHLTETSHLTSSNTPAHRQHGVTTPNRFNTVILAPIWANPNDGYNVPLTFTFHAEPVISGAIPNRGPAGTSVTVTGSGFVRSHYMSCRFGDILVSARWSSDSAIECTVPTGISAADRKIQLHVSLNGQDVSSSYLTFQYLANTSWWTPKRTAIVLGSISGVLILIGVIVAVFVYKRQAARKSPSEKGHHAYRALPSLSLNSVSSDHDSYGIDMAEVKLLDKIGRGSFGDIYKAEWRGTEVAVKKIPFNSLNDDLVQEMLNEARIMESIRHPNVLSLMGCCPRPPEVCIIMEYMPRGSLYQILQDSRIPLSWQMMQRMALDAARGMNFLHQHNPIIMHRDLKSHNLLVDDAWRVKVADFGLSRMIEERVSATMTVCGTPCWTAPEVLRNQRYSVKADVYSFGICLWELYSRAAPYAGMTPFQVMYGVASSGMRPPINEEDCPESWRELMTRCWAESPDDRPTFDEIARTLQTMVLPESGGFH